MDGLTIRNSQRFLEAGGLRPLEGQQGIRDQQRVEIAQPRTSSVSTGGSEISSSTAVGGASFGETLSQAIGNVNQMQKTADKGMENLATGRTDNIADVMLQTEKADIALKLMVQVRNKIIDAYSEIMRMQV